MTSRNVSNSSSRATPRSASAMRAKCRWMPGPRRRVSHDLEQCGGGYLLSLEDDAPIEGERAVFLVNITDPCWIWRGADLTKVKSIRAIVGQIPVQLPDRQGRREDSAAQARDARRRARNPSRRLQGRADCERVAQARRRQPRAHAVAADHCLDKSRASMTSASDSRAPRSIPSGPSAASSSSELTMPSIILAPFAGWCAPLDEVPDAAFAQGLLGDGVAIDPMAMSCARPATEKSSRSPRRATRWRCVRSAGAEILVHVGIDTVALGGRGFHRCTCAKATACVPAILLLTFDLDRVARKAPSLMTPVIVTNGERFRITQREPHRVARQRRRAVRARRVERGRRRRCPRTAARRWSANRWWSRMRTASTRGPRR